MAICQALRKDGHPCQTQIVGNGSFCFGHDPAVATKRTEARQRGGRNKSHAARLDRLIPASLKPTIATLFEALQQVHTGDLEPKQGQAMAALAGAIARLYSVGVLEERIATLEAALPRDAGRMSG
jgi:hypothetical protein